MKGGASMLSCYLEIMLTVFSCLQAAQIIMLLWLFIRIDQINNRL